MSLGAEVTFSGVRIASAAGHEATLRTFAFVLGDYQVRKTAIWPRSWAKTANCSGVSAAPYKGVCAVMHGPTTVVWGNLSNLTPFCLAPPAVALVLGGGGARAQAGER